MKKFTKLFISIITLTMLLCIPCFAQEVTKIKPDMSPEQFVAQLAQHQNTVLTQAKSIENSMADKNAANAHRAMIMNQLKAYNRTEADNYIDYRKKRVSGLKETERIKKEILDNYINLAKTNSYYNRLIPAAQADYNNALAIRMTEEVIIKQLTSQFSIMYPR